MSGFSPEWTIDGLTLTGNPTYDAYNNEYDANGWAWFVAKEEGFTGSAKPRTQREARPFQHGSFRGPNYRDPRIITLSGSLFADTPDNRELAEIKLASLCSDPNRLYELRRRTNISDHTVRVELDDAPLVSTRTATWTEWSFQFAAPDPRRHDTAWQEPISTLPVAPVGGLDPAGGLDPTAGLETGELGDRDASVARVANYGTAPAFPFFIVRGPVPRPQIVDLDRGWAITFAGTLGVDERLEINCDTFTTRNVFGRSAILNGSVDVTGLLVRPMTWPALDPQTIGRYQLISTAVDGAELKVAMRSAYF